MIVIIVYIRVKTNEFNIFLFLEKSLIVKFKFRCLLKGMFGEGLHLRIIIMLCIY